MSSKSSRNRARTRAVRAEMARTGDSYTRSASRAGDGAPSTAAGGHSGPVEGDDAARTHVRRLLKALRAEVQDRLRYIEELERGGDRIVTGGPKGASNDRWEIHDARTGERLAEGTGGPRGYDDAWRRLSQGSWVERDFIGDDWDAPLLSETVTTAGIPIGLSQVLMEWIENGRTPDVEIAAFTGWSVDLVTACRTDLDSALRAGWVAERPDPGVLGEWDDDNPFPAGSEEHQEHDLYMDMVATRDD